MSHIEKRARVVQALSSLDVPRSVAVQVLQIAEQARIEEAHCILNLSATPETSVHIYVDNKYLTVSV